MRFSVKLKLDTLTVNVDVKVRLCAETESAVSVAMIDDPLAL